MRKSTQARETNSTFLKDVPTVKGDDSQPAKVKLAWRSIYTLMKVSQLCSMIEESIRSGRYPLDTEAQRKFAPLLQVINRSDDDNLAAADIKIETRVKGFYVVNNYVPNIEHLPGIVELDVLDSFKIICRKLERVKSGIQIGRL